MKNLAILFVLLFFSLSFSINASAQNTKGDLLFEGALAYGSKIQSLGIQAGGIYTINNNFRIGADAIYYFPGEDSSGLDFNWLEFNANGHYRFISQENMSVYALSGLNFSKFFSDHGDIQLPGGDSTDQLHIGLNIGAGSEFPLGSIIAYIEGKYSLSSAHQLALTGGLRIPI